MRRIAVLCGFSAWIVLAGCKTGDPAPASKDPSPTTSATTSAPALHLGEPIPQGATVTALADIAKNPAAFEGKPVTTEGTVTSVCQKMGCWMEIKDPVGQAHIRMAGHSFFVPKTSTGHHAKVLATLTGVDGEESDCNAEAAQQLGHAVAKMQLEATGVEVD